MPLSLLDELIAADAQGERAVRSLWPGDSFYYKGEYHLIHSMQLDLDKQFIFLRCDPEGEPYLVAGKLHQPRKLFRFHGWLLFPSILSDEHFKEENPEPGW